MFFVIRRRSASNAAFRIYGSGTEFICACSGWILDGSSGRRDAIGGLAVVGGLEGVRAGVPLGRLNRGAASSSVSSLFRFLSVRSAGFVLVLLRADLTEADF